MTPTDTLREAVARYQEEARVVYDRHHDFSNERGPSEGGRIGVAYGSEIFWVGSYCFPGDDMASYGAKVDFAKELVVRWNAGNTAPRLDATVRSGEEG